MSVSSEVEFVEKKLEWMRTKKIFPMGLRYLLPDSFGICAFCSLYKLTKKSLYLDSAEYIVENVEKSLKQNFGYRNGIKKEQFGQYFNYLAKYMFSLYIFSKYKSKNNDKFYYLKKASHMIKEIHPKFAVKGKGVYWRMTENLKEPIVPYKASPFCVNDSIEGLVVYKLIQNSIVSNSKELEEFDLSKEIKDLEIIVEGNYKSVILKTDMQYGTMLWYSHFFPNEDWSKYIRYRCDRELVELWEEPNEKCGYFSREIGAIYTYYSFTNCFVGLALKACGIWEDKLKKLQAMFRYFRSGDHYDKDPFTILMLCNLFCSEVLVDPKSREIIKNVDPPYFKKMEEERIRILEKEKKVVEEKKEENMDINKESEIVGELEKIVEEKIMFQMEKMEKQVEEDEKEGEESEEDVIIE